MELLSLVLGLMLLAMGLIDLLWTALWITGRAGPLTGLISGAAWRMLLRAAGGRHRLLSLFGPVSLIGAIVFWSTLLWLGWALMFGAESGSVLDADTGAAGGLSERLYFAGYALFTMGNGDVIPAPGWRLPTVLMNASGIVLLTLVVSYLISILAAVASARAFGSRVTSLGSSAQAILLAARGEGGFHALDGPLASFAAELSRLAEQHAAYPVLGYYHADGDAKAMPRAVAALDDTLTILEALPEALPEAIGPSRLTRMSLRGAIESYLGTVPAGRTSASQTASPVPAVEQLREAGVPVDRSELSAALTRARDRRAALAAVLAEQGWPWPATAASDAEH